VAGVYLSTTPRLRYLVVSSFHAPSALRVAGYLLIPVTGQVYPTRLLPDVEEQKREGAVAVVDLVGFKKNADGSKGDKLPDLAIGENVRDK